MEQAGVPGTSLSAAVGDVHERGGYLDTTVDAGGFRYRLFFPDDETCRQVLSASEGLRYQWLGVAGRLAAGESRCDAVGVLSLVAWRDRQPRRSREPVPRAPASYREIYRDEDLVLLRGRFPLARMFGFRGAGLLVAVVPVDEACRGVAATDTASMEFRARGPQPLVLINGDRLCQVLGLAQPLPGA